MTGKVLSVRWRYIYGAAGSVVMLITGFVMGAPFWRHTSPEDSLQLYATVYAFDGLWMSCMFQARNIDCVQMGFGSTYYGSTPDYQLYSEYFKMDVLNYITYKFEEMFCLPTFLLKSGIWVWK